jgi:glycosyltransferase involved in cell wall biosynthesis
MARSRSRALNGIPPDATVFLFVFNWGLFSVPRKNPLAAIEAFKRAFRPGENAWLLIKSNFRRRKRLLHELRGLAGSHNIRILDGWLSRDELDDLMASADCYVSLHRAEGFGMTMAEAMALGKPVIATGYSGNMDFMTGENSYLVNYELVETAGNTGAHTRGLVWAEPDIDQAAAYMRRVYELPNDARVIGGRARHDVQKLLSLEVVGQIMKQRLLAVTPE